MEFQFNIKPLTLPYNMRSPTNKWATTSVGGIRVGTKGVAFAYDLDTKTPTTITVLRALNLPQQGVATEMAADNNCN